MNIFTSRIANDEERRRIASRAPVDVFVPETDNTQYVSDFTGDYWPYRSLTVTDVKEDRTAAQRTVDRVLDFALVDTRPPGSNFPLEVYELGESLNADYVFPVTYTGTSRDAIRFPVTTYQNYDFEHQPTLGTPVPHPYELTIDCLNQGLYQNQSESAGIGGSPNPTDFMLRELEMHAFKWESIRDAVETLHESTSGDVNIHLHEPPITGDMIRYIRANPGAIDSIILPEDVDSMVPTASTSTSTDQLEQLFSSEGESYLRGDLCPHVRVAAEFSLLCSSFIETESNRDLLRIIRESVIPIGGDSVQPITDSEASQDTLTSLISQ